MRVWCKMKKIIIAFLLGCIVVFISCSKRNRLTSSTLVLIISPSSVKVAPGNTVEFSVSAKSAKTDNPDIDPEWFLAPASLGTLNRNRGKSVIFTAGNSAGSGEIIVQEGDVQAKATITVGNGGGVTAIVFYDDKGLYDGFVPPPPDILTWSESGATFSEQSGNGAPGD
ncbi:MAG: hypothetical protein ACK4JE_05065, partial [Endomicrobiia bacterium]